MNANDPEVITSGPHSDPKTAPGGASCRVSSAYPAPAPKGAGAARSSVDPGGPADEREVGPGVPTQGQEPQPPTAPRATSRRRRLRQSVPRRTCTSLRFSEAEWTAVQEAANAADLAPGGYAAAATLAAANSANPTAAVADYRRGVQELMESNRQIAAVGNNLNQVAHYLNAGGQPAAELHQLLSRIEDALGHIDDAVAWLVRR